MVFILALWAIGWLLSVLSIPAQPIKDFLYMLFIVLIVVVCFMGYHEPRILN